MNKGDIIRMAEEAANKALTTSLSTNADRWPGFHLKTTGMTVLSR